MKLKDFLLDTLYPARCPLCEGILPGLPGGRKEIACRECVEKIPFIVSPRCMKCGKQLGQMERELCQDCEKREHHYDRGVAAAAYSDALRDSLHRYKYGARREYTPFYVKLIMEHCGPLIRQWGIDVIIPVPMYHHKELVRGYNQATLLADALGELLNIPVDSKILIRSRNTRPMKELNDKERLKNLQSAFKIQKSMIKYKHILLVDDIYTTGTTMDACARCLKQAGASRVYYVSLCIGNGF